ncbi:PREDICTED: photosynthetic NDH subunit of lumenal location 1, chloroplastic [Camelina sativa]|uniref:Photosynthetic NDH subunit of lumenal location 1, chloroplastic n=1 Tax=Camelina sativa TaxID=90675 RepID=A0ABM0Z189_CAMSA|nr:PREDICTED: photosynthetic NDH subunit of lumenal location 1, chloroplastic [Camelina sativa]
MAVSSLSICYGVSPTIPHKTEILCSNPSLKACCLLSSGDKLDSSENNYQNGRVNTWKRRQALVGVGTLVATSIPASLLLAEEIPKSYSAFVDREDGYSYYYPSDWREFDFRAHDSAFKDRYLQLQNVRVRFIPTEKNDIREIGSMEEVVYDLVKHKYAAPNQVATIYDMKERVEDGRNYYTFEYGLRTPIYATTSFATVAVGNNRYYTLIVGANERRWRKVKKQLQVVADSLKILEI